MHPTRIAEEFYGLLRQHGSWLLSSSLGLGRVTNSACNPGSFFFLSSYSLSLSLSLSRSLSLFSLSIYLFLSRLIYAGMNRSHTKLIRVTFVANSRNFLMSTHGIPAKLRNILAFPASSQVHFRRFRVLEPRA